MPDIDLKVVIDAVDNASKVIGLVGNSAQQLGKNMAVAGAGAVAALTLSAKAAIDFETGFAGVRKTIDASDEEFQTLSDNLREIARNAPVSAVELTGIAEMAGQLGVVGVENITKFTETITKFTTATGIAGEEAATNFAQIANVMGEPIANIDKMGSVVAKLGDAGAATERDILSFAQRIAGAGKIAGLTTDSVFAIGSAMASVGVEAEAGGSAVQKVLLDMNTAVLTGSEDLEVFAATAGVSADSFAKMWEAEPVMAFKDFVEGLGDQGDDAILTLQKLGLEDQRLVRAFLSLANAGELLEEQVGAAGDEWVENTRLTEEAEKRYATTAAQMEIMKNNLTDVAITVGAAILPALNDLIMAVSPLITQFAQFAQENPQLVATVLAVGAAIGALGAALMVLTPIVAAFLGIFGAAAALLAGPVVLAIIAVSAVVAALAIAWANNWGGIRDTLTNAWNSIKGIIDRFGPAFLTAFNMVANAIIGPVKPALEWLFNNFDRILGLINRVRDAANGAISRAQEAFGYGGERAMGGPVSSATPVLVGERGPEIFMPPGAGTILPNKDMGRGSGGGTFNITINADIKGEMDIDRLVERLQFAISKQGLL